ncbi:uncharacterized protein K452DRAFT_299268 [Aplosporella prunicola CBS 121167]|uniref:Uncharacterized protein n=1 Tax=Aplosporella prunicola CBS 121167 TaxID=1176127 RepID=A0A6A6B8M4_9PEZI|nr:uncharacterized protein K452DRAFT_299268 [Aplosporella prunicola CBS 121167]KAF2140519.1 hypothetical protein K452DRAFT_299268 [Aplosporella prunicola CBS 121167]
MVGLLTPQRMGHRHTKSDSAFVVHLTTRAALDNERDLVANMGKLTLDVEGLKQEASVKNNKIESQKTLIERLEVKNENLRTSHYNNKQFFKNEVTERDAKIFKLMTELNETKTSLHLAEKRAAQVANMGRLKERNQELERKLAMLATKSNGTGDTEAKAGGTHESPKRSNLTEPPRGVFISKEIQQDAVKCHKRRRTNSFGERKDYNGTKKLSSSP